MGLVLMMVVCLLLISLSSQALAQGEYPVSGYGSTQYRWRQTDDDDYGEATDQDLYGYLSLNFGNPLVNPITGYLFGRLAGDMDGEQEMEEFYPFAEITDTYDNPSERLYLAYIDLNKIPYLAKVSLGRQMLFDTPVWLYLDGALLETAEARSLLNAQLGVYGGVPAHLYEENQENNALYGGLFSDVALAGRSGED